GLAEPLSQAIRSLSRRSGPSVGATVAVTGASQCTPSRERLTRTAERSLTTASDATSQTPCCASKATLGSLTIGHGPAGVELAVVEGRKPRVHVAPRLRENEKPMLEAPPPKIRPLWNTARTDEPTANESGSTCVSCWLCGFRYGSREISRLTTSQSRATRSDASAVTMSRPRPQETVSRTPFQAWMRSARAVPRRRAAEAGEAAATRSAAARPPSASVSD